MIDILLKSVFLTTIEDKSFQKDIVEQIDSIPDFQSHNTNVKAKMTSWFMQNRPGFTLLHDHMLSFCNNVVRDAGLIQAVDLYVKHMWGLCYKSEEHSLAHDHWPATFSCVYYINPPVGGPNLYFSELNREVIPQDGLLVLFPGTMKHEVKKKSFEGKRFAVAANICSR